MKGAQQHRLFLPWLALRANDDYSEGRQIARTARTGKKYRIIEGELSPRFRAGIRVPFG
jgi:hypothetical protein